MSAIQMFQMMMQVMIQIVMIVMKSLSAMLQQMWKTTKEKGSVDNGVPPMSLTQTPPEFIKDEDNSDWRSSRNPINYFMQYFDNDFFDKVSAHTNIA